MAASRLTRTATSGGWMRYGDGSKNQGHVIHGDDPSNRDAKGTKVFQDVYTKMTGTDMMKVPQPYAHQRCSRTK
jgi:hypothetical protein